MGRGRLQKAFGIDVGEHGNVQWRPSSTAELEVIYLGLSRTGTTSIRAALDMLGFGPVHHCVEMYGRPDHLQRITDFMRYLNKHPKESTHPDNVSVETRTRLRTLMRGCRSTLNGPQCTWISELVATYPNAKFVLTVRDSRDAWWVSWSETVGVYFLGGFRYWLYHVLVYPVGFLRKTDEMCQVLNVRHLRDWGISTPAELKKKGPLVYDLHVEHVRRMVPKGQLLEYNVKEGWAPLCELLGVRGAAGEVPNAG